MQEKFTNELELPQSTVDQIFGKTQQELEAMIDRDPQAIAESLERDLADIMVKKVLVAMKPALDLITFIGGITND